MTDKISKAFENISITDFIRSTSAVGTLNQDFSANWKLFTDELVQICTKPEFETFAVLHNETVGRIFKPDEDETVIHFANRLNREAKVMDATWFFSAVIAPGRTYEADNPPSEIIEPNNLEQVQAMLDNGSLDMGICWFSRRLRPAEELAGFLSLDEAGSIVRDERGAIDPMHNPFDCVLK